MTGCDANTRRCSVTVASGGDSCVLNGEAGYRIAFGLPSDRGDSHSVAAEQNKGPRGFGPAACCNMLLFGEKTRIRKTPCDYALAVVCSVICGSAQAGIGGYGSPLSL